MTAVLRVSVLGLVGTTLLGVAWAQPDFLNIGALAESRERQSLANQRQQVLDRRYETAVQRTHAKQVIIDELLAGRLTLLEAARRFKNLNESPITCQDDYRSRFPGRCDGEKVCRQVLAWVDTALQQYPPDQARAVAQRFEDDLQKHLQRHGDLVVLPD
jgi:hypothetical protein